MSMNPQHIRENFEAADIDLTPSEIEQINKL
jgi:diketogulonate reductase-like aldo/keto reductase